MRHIIAFLAFISSLVASPVFADYPPYTGMVTDVAGLLPPNVHAKLEGTLLAYREQTSIEIAVLIVSNLEGQEPHDYAQGVWKKWRIGKQGQDNGVLLLVAPPPEKKAWIATGYGIQGWLTDVDCKHIIAKAMHPLNQQEKRVEAVEAGVSAIMAKLGDTPWAQRKPPPKKEDNTLGWVLFWIFVIIVFVWLIIRYGGNGRSYGGGSSWFDGGSSGDGGSGGGGFDFGGGDSGGGGGGGGD